MSTLIRVRAGVGGSCEVRSLGRGVSRLSSCLVVVSKNLGRVAAVCCIAVPFICRLSLGLQVRGKGDGRVEGEINN